MITRRAQLAGLGAALLTPGGAVAQTADDPALSPMLDTLTALPLRTLQNVLTTLGDHLRPGPTAIAFWATWCSPCLAEGRDLARIRSRTPPERLNIIGLNMDREATRQTEQLARFMRRARMNYTQLWGNVPLYRAFNNPGEGGSVGSLAVCATAAPGASNAAPSPAKCVRRVIIERSPRVARPWEP